MTHKEIFSLVTEKLESTVWEEIFVPMKNIFFSDLMVAISARQNGTDKRFLFVGIAGKMLSKLAACCQKNWLHWLWRSVCISVWESDLSLFSPATALSEFQGRFYR